ncbi:MAG: VanW family protein [Desulfitobacteriaceae bacterium]|nr:VanW family protein [Desulfitobacteriaceae bacterium]MDI6878020.1 VanW family protein [Desulfitobacteriaceae bacterium]MDI6914191.1 VanW family protein [Desulfitobacteriaceae bacterium]
MRQRNIFFAVLLLLGSSGLSGCASGAVPEIRGMIAQGTHVDNLDLSGLEVKDGKVKLEGWAKDRLAEKIVLVYNETEIPVALSELGIELDLGKTWEKVSLAQGSAVSAQVTVDKTKAAEVLHSKLNGLAKPAQDASYRIVNDKFVLQPGVPGKAVVVDSLLSQLDVKSAQEIPRQIQVPVVEVSPAVTTATIQALAFDAVVGEFSTQYSLQEENRAANLQEAAKALDRKVVLPGETFSFNGTVGPRTPETGYKDAYVIVNNEYVQGTGGGVCQVSSTIYNAVLLAGLPIVERVPHAVAIAYVPLGQDATVNYSNIDFKFKNNTPGIIYIRTEAKGGQLTIRLYGKKSGQTVQIEHEIKKETDFQIEKRADPDLPPGKTIQEQAGSKGYTVESWRILRDSQGKESKEYLGKDDYAPANRIIRYGVK